METRKLLNIKENT